jgi:2-succinyl-6-hydroxy-2,4-cyclohexadiene-1-carboxylate synthase
MGPVRQARRVTQWLLLHGFTGAPESWLGVARQLERPCELFVPALPGHRGSAFVGSPAEAARVWSGRTPAAHVPAVEGAVSDFEQTVDALARWAQGAGFRQGNVAGYSLGGRLALALALAHPTIVNTSVLISAHPGLRTAAERHARQQQDAEWIRLLKAQPFEHFLERWSAQPLFASQARLEPDALRDQDRIRRQQLPEQLARSLHSAGLGQMPDQRRRLQSHRKPVVVLAGRADTRFADLAAEMVELAPRAQLHIVDGAHHNLLLESPSSVARVLDRISA